MVRAFNFAVALLGATTAFASAADEYFEGDGTSYTLGQVSSGNCNFMSAIPSASTNYVALNEAQWDNLGGCGRCIEVSCVDEQCTAQNKTAVVQVLDRCPECAHGALDLSPTVYKEITGLDPNRLAMRWRFVDCPDPGTVQVCLKEGSNSNWIAVQPTNGAVGVKRVTVNGADTTMLDGAYYYVSTASGADLSAVRVAITSIDGDEISGSYSLTAGKCTGTNEQFGGGSTSQTSQTTSTPATTTAAPNATPTSTTSTPSTTAPASTSVEGSYGQEDGNSQENQSSQSDNTQNSQSDTVQNEASTGATIALIATTAAPEATTATPEATTPEATTATPEVTTGTPESTTPDATTSINTPETTSATTDAPTQSGDTSKCRVRRHRN